MAFAELTEMVVMPGEDYQDICDAIREKSSYSDAIVSGKAAQLIRNISGGEGGGSTVPGNFTKFEINEYIPTADTKCNVDIPHSLGEAPNFFCIYAKSSSSVGSGYLISGIATKLAGSSGQSVCTYSLSASRASFDSTATTFSLNNSNCSYKANITYEWIAGVI